VLRVRFCAGVREGYGKHLGFRLRLILGAPGRRSRMFAMVIFRGRSSGWGSDVLRKGRDEASTGVPPRPVVGIRRTWGPSVGAA